MKKLIIGLLIFIPLQIASGQDRIITVQQDTIHCRIISISSAHIQYEQKAENGYVAGKFIPIGQVSGYYQNPQPKEINPYYRAERQKIKPAYRWTTGLQTGGSFMLASSVDSEREMTNMGMTGSQSGDYYKQFKRGWNLNGDIYYMDSDHFGFGARYSFFTSSVQKDFIVKSYDNNIPLNVCVGIKERQYIHYVAPSVMIRQWPGDNHQFQLTETLSMGYVRYRDEVRMDATLYLENALAEGNTWGATCGISFDYFPVSWLSVGMNAGFMYARLTKMKISTKDFSQTVDLPKEYYESLPRLDFSLGIHFHFN